MLSIERFDAKKNLAADHLDIPELDMWPFAFFAFTWEAFPLFGSPGSRLPFLLEIPSLALFFFFFFFFFFLQSMHLHFNPSYPSSKN